MPSNLRTGLWMLCSAVFLCLTVPDCVCGGRCCGGPGGPCPSGTIERENVDCSFCCGETGQSCSPADQGTTCNTPCCSGSCVAGKCAPSSPSGFCRSDADCTTSLCVNGTCVLTPCTSSAGCPSGQECALGSFALSAPNAPACINDLCPTSPDAGDAGACFGGTNAACVFDIDCYSGFCDAGACACQISGCLGQQCWCLGNADCCSGKCDDAGICLQ